MLVDELVLVNTKTPESDIWHWYPIHWYPIGGRLVPSIGDKARCGHIYTGSKSNYPGGSECVVCADLRRR